MQSFCSVLLREYSVVVLVVDERERGVASRIETDRTNKREFEASIPKELPVHESWYHFHSLNQAAQCPSFSSSGKDQV